VYVGGDFHQVGGVPRNHVAAIDKTTGVPTSWNPDASGNDPYYHMVWAIAVDGATVYVGGDFNQIGGQPRNCIAALNSGNGLATSWNPNASGGSDPTRINALEIDGSTIYAGGQFSQIGGQPRSCIAALDGTTGLARTWNPNCQNCTGIYALKKSGPVLYVGGYFG